MEVGLLGPLRVTDHGRPIDVPGAKERRLLAVLASRVGRTVPVEDLVDALWGEQPPRTASKSLQNCVLRLRKAVGSDVVVTDAGGYRLGLEPEAVDAERFVALAGRVRAAAEAGRPAEAAASAREALALWRGSAYAGAGDAGFAAAQTRRLDELRLAVHEDLLRADLDLGRAAAVAAEAEQLLAEHPYREGLWVLLALARYRTGRPGEALATLDRARRRLADDLGVDPGPELRDLHARVLAHDPGLRRPAPVELPLSLRAGALPLVGRDAELAALLDAWARARAGGAMSVLVRGPAGSGRTRLAAALAARVAADGAPVADVRGGGGPPDHGLVVGGSIDPAPGLLVLRMADAGADPERADVVVDLEPLTGPEVRRLVGHVVEPADVETVAELVHAGGPSWPGAALAAASGWARDTAAARVERAADELGDAGDRVARARHEVEAGVLALDAVEAADPPPPGPPWRGLAAYDVADAPWFVGRERLVAQLLSAVARRRPLTVVGASGSGKSSLVRAGLVAAVRAGRLPGSSSWRTVVLRPGEHPMRSLAREALEADDRGPATTGEVGDALVRLLRGDAGHRPDHTLLVVDQLEEAWTLCGDAGERAVFLDTLADLVEAPGGGVSLVLAVRADHTAGLAEHARLAGALADGTVLVGSPTPAEVQRVVELPARRAGVHLDVGLADAIVADVGEEPGRLPLLSVALTRLWEHRDGDRLTFDAYVGADGLSGAIAHLAEEAYLALDEEHRGWVRPVLLRLAGPGAAAEATRRPAPAAELVGLGDQAADVVEHFTAARLLTRDRDRVEVAHESLLREWPRLAAWLLEDTAGRSLRRRIAEAAAEWDDGGRDVALLWRGTRLEAAAEQARLQPDELTDVEAAFVAAAVDAVDDEHRAVEERARQAQRQNRRLRGLVSGLAVVLALALAAGVLALVSRARAEEATEEARRSAAAADAKRLAATALTEERHDTALLEAVEAVRSERTPETEGALLTLLTRTPDLVTTVRTPARFLRAGATPDGTVFLAENGPVLRALDAATGEERWQREVAPGGQVLGLAGGAAGLAVTLFGDDGDAVALLDPGTGEERWRLEPTDWSRHLERLDPGTYPGLDAPLVWLDDGRLAFVAGGRLLLASADGDLADGGPADNLAMGDLLAWPGGRLAYQPDVPGGATTVVVGLPGGPTPGPRTIPHDVEAVSPDGTLYAEVSPLDPPQVRLRIRRTADDSLVGQESVLAAYNGALAWSPDGTVLLVGEGEAVQVRDGATGLLLRRLDEAHGGTVMEVVVAGDVAWAAGRDGLGTAWDLTGRRGFLRRDPLPFNPHTGDVSDGGRLAAVVRYGGEGPNTTDLVEIGSGRAVASGLVSPGCRCQVWAASMAPDDALALGAVQEWSEADGLRRDTGRLAVWEADGTLHHDVPLPWDPWAVAATPGAERAVVAGSSGLAVVDLGTGDVVATTPLEPALEFPPEPGGGVAVSADGRRAAVGFGPRLLVVDTATGEVLDEQRVGDDDISVTLWSSGDRAVVVGTTGGHLHVLDGDDLDPLAPRRLIVPGWVLDLETSPDGATMASLGTDGDVRLWDTATWAPLGQPVTDQEGWGFLHFEDDRLAVLYEGDEPGVARPAAGRRVSFEVDRLAWLDRACGLAARALTEDEWAVARPGVPYRDTCGTD